MAAQTVIGFFDDQAEAQRAIEQLQGRGISRDRIDFSSGGTNASSTDVSTTDSSDVNPVSGSSRDENSVRRTADDRTVDREGRNTNKFTDFFNNLFGGSDNDDAERYSKVHSSGCSVVTVHASDAEEAEDAADILDKCGAVDVDERATRLGFTNTRSSESLAGREQTVSGKARIRSRIVDRPLEERFRLRDTTDTRGSSGTMGRNDMDDLSTRGL